MNNLTDKICTHFIKNFPEDMGFIIPHLIPPDLEQASSFLARKSWNELPLIDPEEIPPLLNTFLTIEGNLFYMPLYMVHFCRQKDEIDIFTGFLDFIMCWSHFKDKRESLWNLLTQEQRKIFIDFCDLGINEAKNDDYKEEFLMIMNYIKKTG